MPDSREIKYALGAFSSPATYSILEEISPEDYQHLGEAVRSVMRLNAGFHYKLVERNYVDLQSVHQFITITLSLGRAFATPDRRQLGEALMTSVVNWLTAMRLFLDHEETELKRRFGKTSQQVARLKAATAAAYDERVGYRFSYRFRNYVQHCGLPLSQITLGPVKQPGTLAKQSVDLVVDRDTLLGDFGEWGPVKKDIADMPTSFGLLPLAAEAMEGLRSIHRTCTEIDLDEALERCDVLVGVIDRIASSEPAGQPILLRYAEDADGFTPEFAPTMIPADGVRRLAAVTAGAHSRDSLFTQNSPTPLFFDPSTVRERFHRDNRGVQVLSAWITEKGGTQAFFDAVNAIIAEDKGVEPLITGLVNVSGLLAHMTAGALGTSVEGLVGGLLDTYAEFHNPEPPRAADPG